MMGRLACRVTGAVCWRAKTSSVCVLKREGPVSKRRIPLHAKVQGGELTCRALPANFAYQTSELVPVGEQMCKTLWELFGASEARRPGTKPVGTKPKELPRLARCASFAYRWRRVCMGKSRLGGLETLDATPPIEALKGPSGKVYRSTSIFCLLPGHEPPGSVATKRARAAR